MKLSNDTYKSMVLKNSVYDVLKYIAQILIPAIATLYFSVSQIWGLPYGEQIVGTLTAVDAFLGVCLGISSDKYHKSIGDSDETHK